MTSLAERTVLVTGANRGMGREYVAQLLGRKVAKVYAATRNPLAIDVSDPRVIPLQLDVTDAVSVAEAADLATDVGILINNAGISRASVVKRSRDPSDLRAVLVDITPQGRAVHGESLANRRAALAALLSQLPRSDLETLRKALAPLERLASGEPASGPASNSPARKRA